MSTLFIEFRPLEFTLVATPIDCPGILNEARVTVSVNSLPRIWIGNLSNYANNPMYLKMILNHMKLPEVEFSEAVVVQESIVHTTLLPVC